MRECVGLDCWLEEEEEEGKRTRSVVGLTMPTSILIARTRTRQITEVKGKTLTLSDGSTIEGVDVILLGTGYRAPKHNPNLGLRCVLRAVLRGPLSVGDGEVEGRKDERDTRDPPPPTPTPKPERIPNTPPKQNPTQPEHVIPNNPPKRDPNQHPPPQKPNKHIIPNTPPKQTTNPPPPTRPNKPTPPPPKNIQTARRGSCCRRA